MANLCEIRDTLQKELGDTAEFFYDIHCTDPYGVKDEFEFPIAAVHATGLYLVLVLRNLEGANDEDALAGRLDYAVRVFRSYFLTRVPVRCLFVLRRAKMGRDVIDRVAIYDVSRKKLERKDVGVVSELAGCIHQHVTNDGVCSDGDEMDSLISGLTGECSKVLHSDSEGVFGYVKRGSEWFPISPKDSNKVFNCALWGGFLGVHRFYLGYFWSGLLYLFTFGLFGIGWIADCVEILLGCWNYKGIYLAPLKNRVMEAGKLALVFGGLCCLIYFSMFHG